MGHCFTCQHWVGIGDPPYGWGRCQSLRLSGEGSLIPITLGFLPEAKPATNWTFGCLLWTAQAQAGGK